MRPVSEQAASRERSGLFFTERENEGNGLLESDARR